MNSEKHANIPLFIPHLGCPYHCVFCDQRAISGSPSFILENAEKTLREAVRTLNGRMCEIAFFGGSFTAIDRSLMQALLDLAASYRKTGLVSGIRLSTRPDCINEEILDILRTAGVTAIELGVQSMDDEVLKKSGRGHTSEQTRAAFDLIRSAGCFSLVGQMMLGLPGSNEEKDLYTAKELIRMGADSARIYPTVVLKGTALEKMTIDGRYNPLSLEEGIARGAKCLRLFLSSNVKVLRLGLCAEESCEEAYVAGCYHPAYGEMVKSRLYLDKIIELLEKNAVKSGDNCLIYTAKGEISSSVGYKKENKRQLFERYGVNCNFFEDEHLEKWQINVVEGQKSALKKSGTAGV